MHDHGPAPTGHSTLAVFAHPDDESLSAGGLLAMRAARGSRTAVLTPTWSPDSTRADELAEAAKILGAQSPRMLGWADARVPHSAPGRPRWCDVPLDEAVRALVGHLRDFRPDVVLTHDALGGATGHEDHVQTHRVVVLAVEASAQPSAYPDAGPAWRPREVLLATHPHSSRGRLGALLDRRLRHTVPDSTVSDRVDVSAWLGTKVEAILAHRTEVERGSLPAAVAAMSPAQRRELLGTEWYVRRPVAG